MNYGTDATDVTSAALYPDGDVRVTIGVARGA